LPDDVFETWLAAAERRYLADLTRAELGRALRALSSCYLQRRGAVVEGRALEGRGKRAAFALYYAPLHFLIVREIARALAAGQPQERGAAGLQPRSAVIDLGCGTGTAGAAWASVTGAEVTGLDVSPWAVQEASWTYRTMGVRGRARRGGVAAVEPRARPSTLLAAFVINELSPDIRAAALRTFVSAAAAGHRVVIVEPIARTLTPWWREWETALAPAGAQSREWRVPVELPPLLRDLDRAARLDHRELTARTLVTGA
jgi:SAM-dependent methyltransferase